MSRTLIAVPVLAALSIAGCSTSSAPEPAASSPTSASTTSSTGSFTKVEASSAFEVSLSIGKEGSYEVTASPKLQDRVRAEISDGTLYLGLTSSNGLIINKGDLKAVVVAPENLASLTVSGAANVTASELSVPKLTLNASGGSKVTAGLSGELATEVTGASTLKLSGTSPSLSADVSGASTLSAFDLEATKADLVVSGASKAQVNASESLDINASGASNVTYQGAANVTQNSSGASTIKKAG